MLLIDCVASFPLTDTEEEKSSQIQLMKAIYASATEVQVYLGESGILDLVSAEEQATWEDAPRSYWYGDDRDLQQLSEYGDWQTSTANQISQNSVATNQRRLISCAYTILRLLASARCLKGFVLENHNPEVWAGTVNVLHRLSSSAWWTRVWVVEEVILATKASTIYGEVVAPFDFIERGGSMIPVHIERCCATFFQGLPSDQKSHLHSVLKPTVALELLRHEHFLYAEREAEQLQRFLGITRARGAYDARDKIYSLLGLTQDCSERLNIVPDYSKPVSQVYADVAFKIIQRTRSLEILATAEQKNPISEIPTWCPDWSSSNLGEENDAWIHWRSRRFDAGPLHGNVAELWQDRMLVVKGADIDVVSQVTLPLTQNKPAKLRVDEFADMVSYHSNPEGSYVAGGSVKDAFWRTMLNDCLELAANERQDLTVGDEADFILWWSTETPLHYREFARSFWFPNEGRAFFTTKQGYMGFGPPDTKRGDLVIALMGSRMPFILRDGAPPVQLTKQERDRVRRCFSIVGYCYVHGVMGREKPVEHGNIFQLGLA